MGKISKNANIYDLQGNILRHVDEDGKLHNYTTEELEKLVDKLADDKDEDGRVKNPEALNNVNAILFQMYQKYGNPHEKEIIEALKKAQERKTTVEAKEKALQEVAAELDSTEPTTTEDISVGDGKDDDRHDDVYGEYVEFEEIAA